MVWSRRSLLNGFADVWIAFAGQGRSGYVKFE